MLFLTNEFTKTAQTTILWARYTTPPELQAGASWVERKGCIRVSLAPDSPRSESTLFRVPFNSFYFSFSVVFTALSTGQF